MLWAIGILTVITALLGVNWWRHGSMAAGADQREGAAIFAFLTLIVGIIDFMLFLIWLVVK